MFIYIKNNILYLIPILSILMIYLLNYNNKIYLLFFYENNQNKLFENKYFIKINLLKEILKKQFYLYNKNISFNK